MKPNPSELYRQAKGDDAEYHRLMVEHGHIQRRTETPAPHPFAGRTRLCFCSTCGGRFDAPWHTEK
jgi:hypothetical protein